MLVAIIIILLVIIAILIKTIKDMTYYIHESDDEFNAIYMTNTVFIYTLKCLEDEYNRDTIFHAMVNGMKLAINAGKIEVKDNLEKTADFIIRKLIDEEPIGLDEVIQENKEKQGENDG